MSKPARPRTPAPAPTLTPAEQKAVTRARSWLLTPSPLEDRTGDKEALYLEAATSALLELRRLLYLNPQPQAEPDLDTPIAAALAPPVWVSPTGIYPVVESSARSEETACLDS